MKAFVKLFVLLALLATASFAAGCGAASMAAAEKALEEATGFKWDLTESEFVSDTGVQTPYDWKFLFGVNLSADQASLLNGSFSVDLSLVEKAGFSLPTIENQIIAAHATAAPNKKAGLRYANKILFQDQKVIMDGDSITKLGDSIGASGAGWYGVYYTMEAVGFLKGTVKDCNGHVPQGDSLLVNATDGPFWTFASSTDGSWALPSINEKSAAVNFNAGDCAGSAAAPVTDTTNNPDPKDGAATPPANTPLNDKTNVIFIGDVNLVDSLKPGTPATGNRYEFDDSSDDWTFTGSYGDCFDMISDKASYDLMFPSGSNKAPTYGLLSTGWKGQAGKTTCTVSRTFTVPAGATVMQVSYDFLSQEYPVWIGSAYNDIFTVMVQGDTEYAVHRTINGQNNWQNFDNSTTPPKGQIGWIANSPDALDNTATNPSDPQVFNGHLKWGVNNTTTPRGRNDSNDLFSQVAAYPVTAGATITVLITVSDVTDAIYDSAAAIEYIAFQ